MIGVAVSGAAKAQGIAPDPTRPPQVGHPLPVHDRAIRFPPRSAQLDDAALQTLRRVSALLQQWFREEVRIYGYAEDNEAENWADRLSLCIARAEVVRDTLILLGIAAERLTSEGKVDQSPDPLAFSPSRQVVELSVTRRSGRVRN